MILFIDDEPPEVEGYTRELTRRNHELQLVEDADAALSAIERDRERIDLVILDIMMKYGKAFTREATGVGELTGVLLYERIRHTEPDLPVIILTNKTDPLVTARFRGQHRCWFCYKPDYNNRDLADLVDTILLSSSRN